MYPFKECRGFDKIILPAYKKTDQIRILTLLAFINSTWGWVVILFIAILLFGRRLPGVARNLGQGINEFKKGLNTTDAQTIERLDEGRTPPALPRAPASATKSRTEIDDTSV